MSQFTLYFWFGLTGAIALGVAIFRKHRYNKALKLSEFLALGFSMFATITSFQLIGKSLTDQAFQKCLETTENIVALILGSSAAIWLACQEMVKLFEEPPQK